MSNIGSSPSVTACLLNKRMEKNNPAIQAKPKINYWKMSVEEMTRIQAEGRHPKLLMHACCAPCSAFPLEFLSGVFEVTFYYNNSNIYPAAEYQRRLEELKRYLEEVNPTLPHPVQLIVPPYRNEEFTARLAVLKDVPEGGGRCFLCYGLRMDEAYRYASEHHYDYFTTVMTISRQKNSQKLNEIGRQLSHKYPNVPYFYSDFKKKKGIDRGQELSRLHQLYRQDYCGCLYSYEKRQEDKQRKIEETSANQV